MIFLTYLKYLIELAVAAFLAGISFAVGMSVFNENTDEEVVRRFLMKHRSYAERIGNPSGFEIFGTEARINDGKLEFMGVVSNIGHHDWSEPVIRVRVFAGSLEIGRCAKAQMYLIRKGESKNFVVRCENIKGTDVPDFIKFETRVVEVRYERKSP
jgi:hypothetical protein